MDHLPRSTEQERPDPNYSCVFKGMRRSVMLMGVPLMPAIVALVLTWFAVLVGGLVWWVLLGAIWPILWMITKHDERAFHILWLGIRTRVSNGNKAVWQGSSYTPLTYSRHRPWRRRS
ncbi:type IV secretion system protein VirB3 [Castellaniella sp. UC4442_H9]